MSGRALATTTVALAATSVLPAPLPWLAALAAIVVLGVPHGALDAEVARPWLRPRVGRAWFMVFSLPYLAMAAGVLLAWRAWPEATLAAFLAGSVLHFGRDDPGVGRSLDVVLLRGGLPIALPVLLHAASLAHIFSTVAGIPMAAVPPWLEHGAVAWAVVVPFAVARLLRAGRWQALAELAATALAFAFLPPLTAFAFYFVAFHAARQMALLAAHPTRAPRVTSRLGAVRHALPVSALTLLIGALLWPCYGGAAPERLLAITIQGLAALTLPHMLLGGVIAQTERG